MQIEKAMCRGWLRVATQLGINLLLFEFLLCLASNLNKLLMRKVFGDFRKEMEKSMGWNRYA
jgi:hypothetical protein